MLTLGSSVSRKCTVAVQYGQPGAYPGKRAQNLIFIAMAILMLFEFGLGVLVGLSGPAIDTYGLWVIGAGLLGTTAVLAIMFRWLDRNAEQLRYWLKGSDGEKELARQLARLSDEYTVFHGVDMGPGGGDIDHLVIGPTGVFCIDAKNWTGNIVARDGKLFRDGHPDDSIQKNVSRTTSLRERLEAPGHPLPFFRSLLVFIEARVDAPFSHTKNANCLRLADLRSRLLHPPKEELSERQRGWLVQRVQMFQAGELEATKPVAARATPMTPASARSAAEPAAAISVR